MNYDSFYKRSIEQPEAFWAEQADKLAWYKKPKTILSQDKNGFWYASLDKPKLEEKYWMACPGKFIVIPKGYAPIYSGDWKASLVERTQ